MLDEQMGHPVGLERIRRKVLNNTHLRPVGPIISADESYALWYRHGFIYFAQRFDELAHLRERGPHRWMVSIQPDRCKIIRCDLVERQYVTIEEALMARTCPLDNDIGSALLECRASYETHQELFDLSIAMSAPDEDELVIVELRSQCIRSRSGGSVGAPVGSRCRSLIRTDQEKKSRSENHGLRFCNQTKTTTAIKIATKTPIIPPLMFFLLQLRPQKSTLRLAQVRL